MKKKRASQSSSDSICSHLGLCYDHPIKQCRPCADRSKGSRTNLSVNNTTCHHISFCYDRLIEQCVSCEAMQRGTAKERIAILRVTTMTPQAPALLEVDQACLGITLAVYVFLGIVLVTTVFLFVTRLKQKRRKRVRKSDEEDPKENENVIICIENEAHKGHSCLPGNDDSKPAQGPDSIGTSDTAKHNILIRNMHYTAIDGSDVTEAASLSACDLKNTIPVPATELGATMLVTTKTTQEDFIGKEVP
ncbi:uncharacterized protein LOC123036434 [Varanus komodoensis]|uniref:uncharacterized protein LOC123036434 n=1 Tax=Varanus komodoensis TaxID=61221 RepID=UPI001CF78C3C|nr:uncharacterized protein LOC123036434 [Varanus komodoensis]